MSRPPLPSLDLASEPRRHLLRAAAGAALLTGAGVQAGPSPSAGAGTKVLRYAFRAAETSLDPTQINDIYSRILTGHLFEALYTYDHLARPARIKPNTATAMPQPSDGYRTWTMSVRPGIYFADDPVFKGQRRELVAEDYVYTFKRFADPKLKSPTWTGLESEQLLGLAEARKRALDSKQPFDYDAPIEGIRVLDRYTLQFRLREARPRFVETLAANDLYGAVAREVVEHYGDRVAEHPVGTGPFVLKRWRRTSLIVLARNPGYRERFYDAEPNADDAEGQTLLARFKGRRLPLVDRVEVSIIEENQPRWLAFVNGQHNVIEQVPPEFAEGAVPNGTVAPYLGKQGVQAFQRVRSDQYMVLFNMEDPLVGGYTPERVALRRAIGLGLDVEREIRVVFRHQGVLAQSPLPPNTASYDPAFKSAMSEYNPARANALLDLYGYTDRNGDGWREQPDGSPLQIVWNMENNQRGRQFSELWQRDLKALGLKVSFKIGKWPELLKAARAGNYSVWHLGGVAAAPDSQGTLARLDSKQIGGQNMARFKRPEFDAIYDRLSALPDGPEREALYVEAKRLAVAWMPYKGRLHTIVTDLCHAEVIGFRRPLFWLDWWQYVDVTSPAARSA
jgi:ABC-type transport system substrate-binding protein